MATNLSISIPDGIKNRVLDAVAVTYNYQATIKDENGNDVPNGQTKAQFAKQIVTNFIKEIVRAHESRLASDAARTAALAQTDSDINL